MVNTQCYKVFNSVILIFVILSCLVALLLLSLFLYVLSILFNFASCLHGPITKMFKFIWKIFKFTTCHLCSGFWVLMKKMDPSRRSDEKELIPLYKKQDRREDFGNGSSSYYEGIPLRQLSQDRTSQSSNQNNRYQEANTKNRSFGGAREMFRSFKINQSIGRNNRHVNRIGENSMILGLSLMILMKSGDCCTNTLIAEARTSQCNFREDGSLDKCSVEASVDMILVGLSTESCLKLMSDNGRPLGMIKIAISEIYQQCSIGDTYYIPDPTPKLISEATCYGTERCNEQSVCEKIDESTPLPISNDQLTDPGVSKCYRSTGFWGQGCFYASDTCVSVRHYMSNIKEKFAKVFTCSKWDTIVILTVKMIQESTEQGFSREIKLIMGSPATIESNIKLTLKTVSKTSESMLTDCFVDHQSKLYYTECNQKSNYDIGQIGEV